MFSRDVMISLGALEKGVVIPGCDVDHHLKKLSPEESRQTKRKWRKLFRKALKKVNCHPTYVQLPQKHKKRIAWSYVMIELAQTGRKKLEQKSD
tara:strand:- start:474 stop:755 length:282 start_codon:yes stop_codon:yes gene_type:complete